MAGSSQGAVDSASLLLVRKTQPTITCRFLFVL